MATPDQPRPLARTPKIIALLLAAVAAIAVVPTGAATAEPRPSLSEVERRVDALNARVDAIVERYNTSSIELAAASRKTALAQARVRKAQAQLDALRKSMSAVAAAAYRSGGADRFVQLVSTSTPQTFLDRASSLDRIAATQSAQLAAAATARHRLDAVSKELARSRALKAQVAKALATSKAEIQDALDEQQRLLSGLKADERRRMAASRAAASRDAASRATRTRSHETYNGPASGRAAVAVKEAYNKLGSPYKWAASGPDRFDCSGLTMWVWGKAGVSLPHSSRAQYSGGRKVSRGSLQPGDLVYYGSPIHHVGIYIGGGRMISAPHSGDVVKIQNAFRSDYTGATRP
ncbi:MAG TPA: NlpC/P60 family protein [Mycobacteriales bacterium]|nr:NlpC/P60 family protein [Mycobacteriales bacterium]